MKVLMYCTAACPFCQAAERLLVQKGVEIDKIRFDLEPARRAAWLPGYEARTAKALREMKDALAAPAGVDVEPITPIGDPAPEILDFAEYARAELIVVAGRRHGALHRLLLGSVAAAVRRGAKGSVLVVPQLEAREPLDRQAQLTFNG